MVAGWSSKFTVLLVPVATIKLSAQRAPQPFGYFCPRPHERLERVPCHRRVRMTSNDRFERPTTTTVPRPDAAHDAPRSAPTRC